MHVHVISIGFVCIGPNLNEVPWFSYGFKFRVVFMIDPHPLLFFIKKIPPARIDQKNEKANLNKKKRARLYF